MTRRCNYRCSYCIASSTVSNRAETPEQEKKRILFQSAEIGKLIRNLDGDVDSVRVTLIGGEISLLPVGLVKEAIRNIFSEKVKRVIFVTNLSAPASWYKEIKELCDSLGAQLNITASFHEEFVPLRAFLAKSIEMGRLLNNESSRTRFTTSFVITKSNIGTVAKAFVEEMDKAGILYVINYNRRESWAADEKIYSSNTSRVTEKRCLAINSEDTFGYECRSYQTFIKEDGFLSSSYCNSCVPTGILGMTDKVGPAVTICKEHRCSCCGKRRITRPDGSVYYENLK